MGRRAARWVAHDQTAGPHHGAGAYQLTVTDSVGCKAGAQIALTAPPPLSLACAPALPVSRVRGLDGRIAFMVQGGTPIYKLSWQGPSAGAVVLSQARDTFISALSSGDYLLRVSDRNGCMDSCALSIAEPICSLQADIKRIRDIACHGDANGALAGIAAQGSAPFAYSWTGPTAAAQKDTLENLSPGQYRLTITDAIGCTDSASFFLSAPPPLLAECTVLNGERTRGGDEGRALLRFSGGTGSVQVSWPGPSPGRIAVAADTLFASSLKAGTYTPVFSDQNGCTATCSFTIDPIICKLRSSAVLRHISCHGSSDGQIAINAEAGNLPYTFQWSGGARGEGLNTLSGLAAGPYRVTVTDALNCTDTLEVEITSPAPLQLSCLPTVQISSFGLNDGKAGLGAEGGTPPYRIQLSGKTETGVLLSKSDTTILEGLYAGSYRSVLQDANGCKDTCAFELMQPPCMVAVGLDWTAPGCAGAPTGAISANVSMARPPLQYTWNVALLNGQAMAGGLRAGNYAVTVTDSVGCSASAETVLKDPPNLSLICLSAFPAGKVNGQDGRILLNIQGGTPPYRLLLRGGRMQEYPVNAPGAFTIDMLSRGEYTVVVQDGNGCTAAPCTFRIEDPVCALQTTLTITPPSCAGASDGRIATSVANAVGALQFQWDKATAGNLQSPTGLRAGTYNLRVTDDRLCTDSARVELKDPPLLQISCEVLQAPQTVGGSEGVARIVTLGGTGVRAITWNGPGNIPIPIPDTLALRDLPAGTYSLRVTDANKCLAECTLDLPAVVCSLEVQAAATAPRCFGDSSGTASIAVTGARGAATLRWSNGSTGASLRGIPAGAYSVTVTDMARCTDSAAVFVYNPLPLQGAANQISGVSGIHQSDGSAGISVDGGTPPYLISYTGPRSGQFIRNTAGKDTVDMLPSGDYTIVIRDSAGCTANARVVIDSFRCRLDAAIGYEALSCETAAIGTIVTGAVGVVRYDWDKDEFDGQQNPFPVRSGIYSLLVSDNTGCSSRAVVEVQTSGPMTADIAALDGDCPGDAGQIEILHIKGGRRPYALTLNDGQPRPVGSLPTVLRNIRPGGVRLALRSSDGCTFDTLVQINPVAPALLELGPDLEILRGDSVVLRPIIGFNPETVRWNPETGLKKAEGLSVLASPEITTTYQLIVTDAGGCPVEDQVSIIVRDQVPVYFPTAFSPNGDGSNDYFSGFGGPLVATIEQLNIYDRWGELLFHGTEIPLNMPQNGWDGKTGSGAHAPAGVYVYRAVVKLNNGKFRYFSGEVLLIK
ncbi:MAG: gliding motility-associated C-terminal domain-containing protein [Saprospiraceae bacterium]